MLVDIYKTENATIEENSRKSVKSATSGFCVSNEM